MADADFGRLADPSTTTLWREEAGRLAYARNRIGRARLLRDADGAPEITNSGALQYLCESSNREADDHFLLYYPNRTIFCDCTAAEFGHPCAHAGAVLLLIAQMAHESTRESPPRERDWREWEE